MKSSAAHMFFVLAMKIVDVVDFSSVVMMHKPIQIQYVGEKEIPIILYI